MENIASNSQIHEYSLRQGLSFLFTILAFISFSQSNLSSTNKKALKQYYKAEKKVKERDFQEAISLYTVATELDNTFFEAYLRKGSLYNSMGNEDSVYINFTKYAQIAPSPAASVLERLAFMAFDRGHYQKSQEYLKSFLALVPEKKTDRNISLLQGSLIFAFNQLKNPTQIKIDELPAEINKHGLQYLPSMTVDQKTLVYTKRDQFSSDEDIVVSYLSGVTWSSAESISNRINTRSNEGAASISADGRTMIFTACDRRDSYGSCDLYISYKTGETWSRPKNLGKSVNTKYWESQPSLSADGRTLFFASNRPGGYGGRDIWVTTKQEQRWVTPTNLGRSINSFNDETTPFIHFNGQTLFFSSNSYIGMGGYDLFSTEKGDSTWSSPINLGYPINTFKDEVALMLSSDGEQGYFAKETKKNYEILDSRIVKFNIPASVKPIKSNFISGKVIDKETGLPLKASLEIVDVDTNEKLYDNYSDSISGEFYLVLRSGRNLAGYVKKKGYLYKDFSFEAASSQAVSSDTLIIALNPVDEGNTLILKNIYFETNSYELDERSTSEVQNVVELLEDNPSIAVEISGHTDNIGSDQYNMELSEKRAQAVYRSLIENGITPARLSFRGFGPSKPLLPNDSEISRQSNRRIEFRVIRQKQ